MEALFAEREQLNLGRKQRLLRAGSGINAPLDRVAESLNLTQSRIGGPIQSLSPIEIPVRLLDVANDLIEAIPPHRGRHATGIARRNEQDDATGIRIDRATHIGTIGGKQNHRPAIVPPGMLEPSQHAIVEANRLRGLNDVEDRCRRRDERRFGDHRRWRDFVPIAIRRLVGRDRRAGSRHPAGNECGTATREHDQQRTGSQKSHESLSERSSNRATRWVGLVSPHRTILGTGTSVLRLILRHGLINPDDRPRIPPLAVVVFLMSDKLH